MEVTDWLCIEDVWEKSVPWSEETFPLSTPESIAAHILSEAKELAENPYDETEQADIILLLGHLAYRTATKPALAAWQKLQVNKQRKWGSVNEQGFVEHVKEEEGGEAEPQAKKRPTIEVDAVWDERVWEAERGTKTGRMGTITFYKVGGRQFAKPIVWDDEPQAS